MPNAFAQQLINQYGAPGNYRFSDTVALKTATTIQNGEFGNVLVMQPWNNTVAKGILDHHPVAWWEELSVTVHPSSGAYGRMCSFYGGWSASGSPRPTTLDEILALHGAFTRTWGGTGDPGVSPISVSCNFNDTMTEVLKTPYNESVRPVFYYCFVEQALIDKVIDSDRFLLHFKGTFNVQGKY